MATIRKGAIVQQVQPAPIRGMVTGFSVDQETGETLIIVDWEDNDGQHSKAFQSAELALFEPDVTNG